MIKRVTIRFLFWLIATIGLTGFLRKLRDLCLLQATILKPGWVQGHILLGNRMAAKGCIDEALGCWRQAIALEPDLAQVRVQLVELLITRGRFDEAFSAWQDAHALRPDWPEIDSAIQNAFFFHGQMEIARRIFQDTMDVRRAFAVEHQLDQLGLRVLREFPTAIGHIALLDNYVKMGELGFRSPDQPVLLVHPTPSNPAYLSYWQDHLPCMINDPVAVDLLRPLAPYIEDRISAVLSARGTVEVDYDASVQAAIQVEWERQSRPHLLQLQEDHNQRGWEVLETLGVPRGAWFVALHVRETRTTSRANRDAEIASYRLAIEAIVERGGWVVRMGDPSMTSLPPMPQVLDYVHTEAWCDWMDVFLWARCRFFIGTPSGPAWVPPTFGVPCVATNWNAFFARRWYGQDLFIPKLFWSEKENRYLTFAECLCSTVRTAESPAYLASVGTKLVNNTPEELRDVVVEMLDRLDGTFQCSQEDRNLVARFEHLWTENGYRTNSPIGLAFLQKWAELI